MPTHRSPTGDEESEAEAGHETAKAALGLAAGPQLEPAAPPRYLTGVRGLLVRRLGERSLGWKEKASLMRSRTEGATYVKPWGQRPGQATVGVSGSSALAPALVGPWAVEGLPSSVEQEGREVEEGCSWRHLPASECVPSSAPLLRALARGLGRGTRERCGADKSPRTSQGDPAILFLRGQCVGPESQRRAPVAAVTHVHSHVLSLCLHWGEKEDGMRASMGPLLPWWYKLISQPGPTWR